MTFDLVEMSAGDVLDAAAPAADEVMVRIGIGRQLEEAPTLAEVRLSHDVVRHEHLESSVDG
jgi:hypothetical protein